MPQKRSKNNKSANANLKKRGNPGKSHASTNPDRPFPGKMGPASQFRTKSKIKLLNLYREKIDYAKRNEVKTEPARIEPDRKWFGNVKTMEQKDLDKFRAEYAVAQKDPYGFLLKKDRIDLAKFAESRAEENAPDRLTSYGNTQNPTVGPLEKFARAKPVEIKPLLRKSSTPRFYLTQAESFQDTFGPKMKRVKPKLLTTTIEELAEKANQIAPKFTAEKDANELAKRQEELDPKLNKNKQLDAGQSKRIWEELFKVIDSSDVIVFVLDARDPLGTRSMHVEKHLARNCKLKHVVYLLNKTDLVPTSVTAEWVKYLSALHPTIAFRADINRPFGREALTNLLRQFDSFHKDKKHLSIGFLGYPNVGKSSVINALKKKLACKTAPVPGETRVWQYVALTRRIYLIDCPGVVYGNDNENEVELVLKGVVRAERLKEPELYVYEMIKEIGAEVIAKIYNVPVNGDPEELLSEIAKKLGRLRKGAEPDIEATAKILIIDWQRGEIPHFKAVPEETLVAEE